MQGPGPDEVVTQKAGLRQAMMAARDALPPPARLAAERMLSDAATFARLRPHLPPSGAIIAGYSAIRSEIDPAPLLARLMAMGFRLALPRVASSGLVFHEVEPGASLLPGRFGLLEPSETWPIAQPALFLAPLLAFDAEGYRLGYGKGYYDNAFAENPGAARVGLAYRVQQVEAVPHEAHDVRLHAVLAV